MESQSFWWISNIFIGYAFYRVLHIIYFTQAYEYTHARFLGVLTHKAGMAKQFFRPGHKSACAYAHAHCHAAFNWSATREKFYNLAIMFTLLRGLWDYFFRKEDHYIVILGLDNAGKTVHNAPQPNILCMTVYAYTYNFYISCVIAHAHANNNTTDL